jgi:hypothetical protein
VPGTTEYAVGGSVEIQTAQTGVGDLSTVTPTSYGSDVRGWEIESPLYHSFHASSKCVVLVMPSVYATTESNCIGRANPGAGTITTEYCQNRGEDDTYIATMSIICIGRKDE